MLLAFFSRSLGRRGDRKQASQSSRPRSFVPRLDVLEDRTVPSAFTVTNLTDHDPGSLRAAVMAANANPGADTIKFAPGLHGTIRLSSELTIIHDLTINGPGANQLTVSGNNATRVFDISASNVTIAGLTIANGSAQSTTDTTQQGGGGVLNEAGATVHLNNDVFINNKASVVGGALWNQDGGTVTISDSIFIGNQAIGLVIGTTNSFM